MLSQAYPTTLGHLYEPGEDQKSREDELIFERTAKASTYEVQTNRRRGTPYRGPARVEEEYKEIEREEEEKPVRKGGRRTSRRE